MVNEMDARPHADQNGGNILKWPRDVQLIISAMDAAPGPVQDRRRYRRIRHHVTAKLCLFIDGEDAERRVLYVRDAAPRGVGFVTRHRLPLGYGGQVDLPDQSGRLLLIQCTVHRCREAAPGWYEGALSFNREQFCFST